MPLEQNAARETKAVEKIEKFQNDGGPKHINIDQMNDIASGKISSLGGKEITPEVKAAAQVYVANNGALFDKMEAATDGKHDSRLGAGDAAQGRKKDLVGMSESKAMDTIANMQNDPASMMLKGIMPGANISFDQMSEMATKGTLNGANVSGEEKQAAQAYVANNGALFDKIESSTDGKHDSMLGRGDPEQARKADRLDA